MGRSVDGVCALWLAASFLACSTPAPPGQSYYERRVAPILKNSCEGATAPCHRDDGNGVALGNLDVSSFEAIQKRRDVLTRYGSYPEPLLLMKAVSSKSMNVAYRGQFLPMANPHAAGPIIEPASDAYFTLKEWLDNGATRNGLPPVDAGEGGDGSCNQALIDGVDVALIPDEAPGLSDFDEANAYLVQTCGSTRCHGTVQADFYLSCGSTDEQRKLNYWMARAVVAADTDDSELLVRPLDPGMGGLWHSGGVFFPDRESADYRMLRDWATLAGPLEAPPLSPARRFFEERVMPELLARGCALQACHSPIVPHKLRLRAGSYGFFSQVAADRNYAEVHKGMIALGSPNPLASRLVAKNLLGSHGGIVHRAGPLLETPGASADPADCPQPYDPEGASALCTVAEWLRLERAELDPRYTADLSSGASAPLVYVQRPPESARMIDFAQYRPGADLLRADATLGPAQSIASTGAATSLLSACPGVSGADRTSVDVRGPEPSHDGLRIVFAMRLSAGGGLDLYEVGIDGAGCRKLTADGGTAVNGVTVHNFDPHYVIDGAGTEWVVYASSRAGIRTPKHLLPGADLWRQPLDGGPAEQMTWLRGVERQPAIMANGQLIMTKEKATNDFYQVSGRRLNWDLSDYHPLLANRSANYLGRGGYLPGEVPDAPLLPSFDYQQATEIREAHNGNFLVVLADRDTWGQGGALGLFNRSIGPFEAGRDDPAFVPSLTVLPGPSGRAGDPAGAYRSPYPLADGSILTSYAAGVDVGSATPIDYDLVVVDPRTGQRRVLIDAGGSQVEAVLVFARPPPHPFTLAETGTGGAGPDLAVVHFPDLPLVATLLDSNNRRGRDVDGLRAATRVRFFAHAAPPPDCTSTSSPSCAGRFAGPEAVFESRTELGSAAIEPDGSVYLQIPARKPLLFELLDGSGQVLFRLREEFQLGPGENIGIGVPAGSFNTICGGCHGSISGRELDIVVEPDAVTSASATSARAGPPARL